MNPTKFLPAVFQAFALALLAGVATAQVHVSPEGTNEGDGRNPASPVQTIGYALTQAAPGEEIRLAVGTYVEHDLHITQSQTIVGGWLGDFSGRDPEATFASTRVQPNRLGRAFLVSHADGDSVVRLEFFRIFSADAGASEHRRGQGGGILSEGDGLLHLVDMEVRFNYARGVFDPEYDGFSDQFGLGGGVYSEGSLVMEGGVLNFNVALNIGNSFNHFGNGGGLYQVYNGDPSRTFSLTNVLIDGNIANGSFSGSGTSTAPSFGGGIAIVGTAGGSPTGENPGRLDFDQVVFFNNTSRDGNASHARGGGLYIDLRPITGPVEVSVTGARFEGNSATRVDQGFLSLGVQASGGGAHIFANSQTRVVIEDFEFINNFAERFRGGTVGFGGGVSVIGPSSKTIPTTFVFIRDGESRNNSSTREATTAGGGGFYFDAVNVLLERVRHNGNSNRRQANFPGINLEDHGRSVFTRGGSLEVINNCFGPSVGVVNEESDLAGLAIFASGVPSVTIHHCSFVDSPMHTGRPAVSIRGNVIPPTTASTSSNLFHRHLPFELPSESDQLEVDHTIHDSNTLAQGSGIVIDQGNNVQVTEEEAADFFVNAATGDLRLVALSTPISAGNPALGVEEDAVMNPRKDPPDCGCLEYTPPPLELAVLDEEGAIVEAGDTIDLGVFIVGEQQPEVSLILLAVSEVVGEEIFVEQIQVTEGYELSNNGLFTLTSGQPGEEVVVRLTHFFDPGEYIGTVSIFSNAPGQPVYVFNVRVVLRAPTPPELIVTRADTLGTISPGSTVHLGTTRVGMADLLLELSYLNLGESQLVIESILTFGEGAFEAFPGQGGTVPPGGSLSGSVGHPATSPPGEFTGEVRIFSNDPERPVYSFFVTATVEPPPQPQLAITRGGVEVPAGGTTDLGDTNLSPGDFGEPEFRILNQGEGDLVVTGISITGDERIVFGVAPSFPLTIQPGDQAIIPIRHLRELPLGEATSQVTIASNDPDHPEFQFAYRFNMVPDRARIQLTDQGGAIIPNVNPPIVEMGSRTQGTPTAFTVTHRAINVSAIEGGTPLSVLEITIGEPFTLLDSAPIDLAPGQGTNYFITLPTSLEPGVYMTEVTVRSTDPLWDIRTYQIRGEITERPAVPVIFVDDGTGSEIVFIEGNLDLGETVSGEEDNIGAFRIFNNGDAELVVSQVSFLGDPGFSAEPVTGDFPFFLEPESTGVLFNVIHSADRDPGVYTAEVAIGSNDPARPNYLFTATSTILGGPPGIAVLTGDFETIPNGGEFDLGGGDMVFGETEDLIQSFDIRNTGQSSLVVSSLTVAGGGVELLESVVVPFEIPGGGLRNVVLVKRGATAQPGEFSGTITIQSNAVENSVYNFSAVGFVRFADIDIFEDGDPLDPGGAVAGGAVTFGGRFGQIILTITNVGSSTLEVTAINLNPGVYHSFPEEFFGLMIEPGESALVTVDRASTPPGGSDDEMEIIHNGPFNNPYVLRLPWTVNERGDIDDFVLDYGDAPPPFRTLLDQDGARHAMDPFEFPPIYLGNILPDDEDDGQPHVTARGDLPDEDAFIPNFTFDECYPSDILLHRGPSNVFAIRIGGTEPGFLSFWFDHSGQQNWMHEDDYLVRHLPVASGSFFDLSINVSHLGRNERRFGRIRVTTDPTPLGPNGFAIDGEVEDWSFRVVDIRELSVTHSITAANYRDTRRFTVTPIIESELVDTVDIPMESVVTVYTPDGEPLEDFDGFYRLLTVPAGYTRGANQWTIPLVRGTEPHVSDEFEFEYIGPTNQRIAHRVEVRTRILCGGIVDFTPEDNDHTSSMFVLFGEFPDQQAILDALMGSNPQKDLSLDINGDGVVDAGDLHWATMGGL